MRKKNISILVLAIIILIGSIGFVIWKIEQKKSVTAKTAQEKNNINNNAPENNVPKDNVTIDQMTKEQADFANKFKQDMDKAKMASNDKEASFTGSVNNITPDGKIIVLKGMDNKEVRSFGVNDAAKFFQILTDSKNNQTQSEIKLSEVKLGESAKVDYAPKTNNLISLTVARVMAGK